LEGIEGLPSSAESHVPSKQRIILFGILIKGMRAAIEEFMEEKIGSKEEGKRNRARRS
jgi:hypothetical protein